ncbi:MAG: hypothetical protein RRY29_03575 [Desulfovibrionaceae bacterium]
MDMTEYYCLRVDGSRVHLEAEENAPLADAVRKWGGKGTSLRVGASVFEQQYIAGHEDTLLCRVFRKADGTGGLLVVFDATGLLLVAEAASNLALVAGAGHFARMATYIRYGADIFEHGDDED